MMAQDEKTAPAGETGEAAEAAEPAEPGEGHGEPAGEAAAGTGKG
jgi:hypothetical protein